MHKSRSHTLDESGRIRQPVTQDYCGDLVPSFSYCCSPVSEPLTPATKSSNGVLSPRLLSETIPSASTSKGFLIVGTRVAPRVSCSNSEARWADAPSALAQLLSLLYDGQFKSSRQFTPRVSMRRLGSASYDSALATGSASRRLGLKLGPARIRRHEPPNLPLLSYFVRPSGGCWRG